MDRLLRWIKDIQQATYFDIQNVSDYFWNYPEDKWRLAHFTIAPPFDFFATRYTLPDLMPETWIGGEVLTVFRVVSESPAQNQDILIDKGVELNPYPPVLVPAAKWHLDIRVFSALGRQVNPSAHCFAAVMENGQVATYRNQPALWLVGHEGDSQIGIFADSFYQVSFLALTFLHSKNVEILPLPPPSKKRLPRKQLFESRYHRLKVNAIGQRHESGSGAKTGISQGLHIVRGHFREYGPDFGKGLLFGKYAGRFWVAAHAAGNLESGTVTKDYEVNARR